MMLVIADSELLLLAADLNPNHNPPSFSSDMTVVCLCLATRGTHVSGILHHVSI
jgi:hypothetical protein